MRATALASAIRDTNVQAMGNPCTYAAWLGSSAMLGTIGGAAAGGEVGSQGFEVAVTQWPQALIIARKFLFDQSLKGLPISNTLLTLGVKYRKVKEIAGKTCDSMQ